MSGNEFRCAQGAPLLLDGSWLAYLSATAGLSPKFQRADNPNRRFESEAVAWSRAVSVDFPLGA